jgi:hypothetical protein
MIRRIKKDKSKFEMYKNLSEALTAMELAENLIIKMFKEFERKEQEADIKLMEEF